MDCSTPGIPVHHQLPELAQTHVHWVGDAIQPSHPLSSPSPPAFNLSQHPGFPVSQLFASGGQIVGASTSAPVFPMNVQDWFPLGLTGWISWQVKGLSRVFYNTSAEILQHSTFFIDIQTHETRIPSYCNIKRPSLRHIISNCKKSLKKKEF